VGSLLFVACSIGRIGLTEASRAIWPFVLALVLVNAVLIVFPALTTIVPRLFFD
jgi:C4-dicarboxylate transporter DctM subunit